MLTAYKTNIEQYKQKIVLSYNSEARKNKEQEIWPYLNNNLAGHIQSTTSLSDNTALPRPTWVNTDSAIKMNNLSKIDAYALLEDNWDLNGAEKVAREAILLSKGLIAGLPSELPQPNIAPTFQGEISIIFDKINDEELHFVIGKKSVTMYKYPLSGEVCNNSFHVSEKTVTELIEKAREFFEAESI